AEANRRMAKGVSFKPSPRRAASGQAPVLPQATTAPSALLHRWAGRTAVTHTPPSAQFRHTPLPAQSGKPVQPSGAVQTPQQWTDHVMQRARKQLALPEKQTAHLAENSIAPKLRGKLPQAMPTAMELPVNLAAQWQRPLGGKMAPTDLLAHWQTRSVRAVTTDSAAAAQRRADSPPVSAERRGSQRDTAVPAPLFSLGHGGSAFTPPAHLPQADEELEERPLPTMPTPETPYEPQPRFAPPQMAERLPGLRPLPRPGTANAFPIAANIAKHSARHEAESVPDDLDTLARQIKQILDEESRRHGIDV
ncbi:MAG: hypothetical protein KC415_12230, partial [Anaerolineales bacterium]|nr:hypothetical protein [Anaerolineales bacterium]